ncbi:hypothetical protein WR25_14990 isoform A [Diploscapter pachys]|uniref:Uncharacterized protein n=1 Tax=Diploscapter pachys TaxID=2018661 RepID=A0A2A2L354_9BILA|nr:hypothetical protein WR25_14990 isoform A [Diploscapter pachys]
MQMSYVRRMGDQGGRNTSARGCGKGRGQVSTFQAATAGIPRNRRDAGDGEDEEPYRDNEEADDPQQVRWYGTHASSNAKAMFGGAEVGASTNRRIQDDENDQSRDVAAPSVRRYAAPVRTVQRVGLFGNAKQSECIQNLDQVYPNLQKRVQRQLNEIAAPEDDVEWARGKVPQMQVGNREMEHGKERRRMHDDMNEADMGRGQGMFDQPPSRRALLSPNAGFQQNDDVNFALQPQTLAAHDNRRKRAKSQGARQRADRYEAIRQRVAYPTRLIAEDDEEEEAKIYDRSPPSSSYREPEDGQRKTTSMFASPHMQLPVITDRILQALPPVYLRDDTVESYDSAVIGILAENMRVNKIRNQLLTNAMKMSEHDKAQDKAIRKKQATAMSSFLDKTQCLRSDDLEDDSDDEDEDDRNPSTQPSKERRIFANTHENLFDSDERLDKFDVKI